MPENNKTEFEVIYQGMVDGMLIADQETHKFVRANPAACVMFGYTEAEFLTKGVADIHPAEHLSMVVGHFAAQAEGREVIAENLPCLRKDGTIFYADVGAKSIVYDNRPCLVGFFRDNTKRKRVEEALRESEERFRRAIHATEDGLWEWDMQTNQEFFAPRWCEIIGYSFDDSEFPHTFKTWAERIHPNDYDRVMGALNNHLKNGAKYDVDYRHRHKSGEYRWQNSKGQAVFDESGKPIKMVGCISDITKRKQAEEELTKNMLQLADMNRRLQENQIQLIQSEKMASFGQLAAGVAHEINNPVGFVMSNLGTLKGYVAIFKKLLDGYDRLVGAMREGNTPQQEAILKEIEIIHSEEELAYILKDVDELLRESYNGTERVKDIVQNLKSFVRLDEAKMIEADINDGIEVTLKVIWNELKYKCQVHKKLEPLPLIRCYPSQINQVLLNLLVNAAQAIAEKGDIFIETRAMDKEIVIRIADTGQGIAPEHLPKIFMPFFTTKPAGKGTGLGLSISQGIIQKHHGFIQAESEPGKGTTFTIHLPISAADPE
jgi:PAS domain S-box-containing protein